jgi:hypothetical protein
MDSWSMCAPGVPSMVPVVRLFTRAYLAGHPLADAALITSQYAANAIRHSAPGYTAAISVTVVTIGDLVRIESRAWPRWCRPLSRLSSCPLRLTRAVRRTVTAEAWSSSMRSPTGGATAGPPTTTPHGPSCGMFPPDLQQDEPGLAGRTTRHCTDRNEA